MIIALKRYRVDVISLWNGACEMGYFPQDLNIS